MTAKPPPTAAIWTSPERTKALRQDPERSAKTSRNLTKVLLEESELRPGFVVLDAACGPGDPTIAVADQVGPRGRVIGVDLSEGALEVGRELARKAGLTNVEFRTANVESLPFDDATFDRVTCRFGAMFFEDLPKALGELRRVLKPGGRVAFLVWGRVDQPFMTITVGTLLRHMGETALAPELAVPFRFATPGSLEEAFEPAGLSEVKGRTSTVDWIWEGTPEELRDWWREGVVFWKPLIDRIPAAELPTVWKEIADGYRRFYDGKIVTIPETVRVVTGRT